MMTHFRDVPTTNFSVNSQNLQTGHTQPGCTSYSPGMYPVTPLEHLNVSKCIEILLKWETYGEYLPAGL